MMIRWIWAGVLSAILLGGQMKGAATDQLEPRADVRLPLPPDPRSSHLAIGFSALVVIVAAVKVLRRRAM